MIIFCIMLLSVVALIKRLGFCLLFCSFTCSPSSLATKLHGCSGEHLLAQLSHGQAVCAILHRFLPPTGHVGVRYVVSCCPWQRFLQVPTLQQQGIPKLLRGKQVRLHQHAVHNVLSSRTWILGQLGIEAQPAKTWIGKKACF